MTTTTSTPQQSAPTTPLPPAVKPVLPVAAILPHPAEKAGEEGLTMPTTAPAAIPTGTITEADTPRRKRTRTRSRKKKDSASGEAPKAKAASDTPKAPPKPPVATDPTELRLRH